MCVNYRKLFLKPLIPFFVVQFLQRKKTEKGVFGEERQW